MKTGLALSGGGVGGGSHIGVLKAFEKNKIVIDRISGTSMGAIVAALYAAGYTPDEIESIVLSFDYSEITDNPFVKLLYRDKTFGLGVAARLVSMDFKGGIIKANGLEHQFAEVLSKRGVKRMGDTVIPLAVSAVDLGSAQAVVFVSSEEGLIQSRETVYYSDVSIAAAVRASMSYPVAFKPKVIGGRRLIDGGVYAPVPVRVLKSMGAQRVIASNAGFVNEGYFDSDNMLEIAARVLDMMTGQMGKYTSKGADYVLNTMPGEIGLLEVNKLKEAIDRGYEAAMAAMPVIMSKIYM